MYDVRIAVMGADIVGTTTLRAPNDSLEDVDVVLFILDEDERLNRDETLVLAQRARMRGLLVAGVIVDDEQRDRAQSLATLREATDMLLIVRERASIHSIIAGLA